jgi:hypothetical protein
MGVRKLAFCKSPSNEGDGVREDALHFSGNFSSASYDGTTDQQLIEYRREPQRRSLSSSLSSSSGSRWVASPLSSPISARHRDGACAIATRAYFTSSDNDLHASSSNDYSSSSHSTLQSTSTVRRRVRFEVSVKNEIDAVTIPYSSSIDLGDEKQRTEVWWSQEELTKINNRSRVMVGAFRENSDYIDQYADVFSLCAQSDVDLSQEIQGEETALDVSVLRLLQTEARGLETQILALWHQYRTKFVQKILQTQYELALDWKQSRENQAIILAETSRTYSRTGRILARILATSDQEILIGSFDDDIGPF